MVWEQLFFMIYYKSVIFSETPIHISIFQKLVAEIAYPLSRKTSNLLTFTRQYQLYQRNGIINVKAVKNKTKQNNLIQLT